MNILGPKQAVPPPHPGSNIHHIILHCCLGISIALSLVLNFLRDLPLGRKLAHENAGTITKCASTNATNNVPSTDDQFQSHVAPLLSL